MPVVTYILDGHRVVACPDLQAWAAWCFRVDRTVRRSTVGCVTISTVFVGIDTGFSRAPQVFETLLFDAATDHAEGVAVDGSCRRCGTWEAAERQHSDAVNAVVLAIQQAERMIPTALPGSPDRTR